MEGNNNIYVPHDIILNILKRLPIKSLTRFQCVCKNWKNTIDDPFFIANHLQQSGYEPSLLFSNLHLLSLDSHHLQRREFDNTPLVHCLSRFNAHMRQVMIVGSFNGLLCVRILSPSFFPPIILLWNPAVKEIKEVPRTNEDLMGDWCVGFGFSAIANDYNIIRIHGYKCYHDENGYVRWDYSTPVNRVQVYSLSKDSWNDVEFGAIEGVYVHPGGTNVSNNGAIFWVGEKKNINYMREEVMISFDIETEVFTFVQMPPLHCETFTIPTIYDNKLALLQYHPKSESCGSFHLWVIENTCPPGGRWSWIKKYSCVPISSHPYLLAPINIWGNEIVCRVQEVRGHDELDDNEITFCLLNLNTNEVMRFTMNIGLKCCDDVFNHVESLVPVLGRT